MSSPASTLRDVPTAELESGKSTKNVPRQPDPAGPPGVQDDLEVKGKKLVLLFATMMVSLFLVALDQTILASALPRIVTDFDALNATTWISAGFILVQAASIPTLGQVCSLYTTKYVYLGSIVVFEIGSALCGAAPNVNALIAGRCIAGLGASGLLVSLITLMTQVIPLEKRAGYMGFFGSVFGLASIVGPLLGGAFSDKVSWRWCFYINLVFAPFPIIATILVVKASRPIGLKPGDNRSGLQRLRDIDWLGSLLVLAAVTCLVLGTTWGGYEKGWKDPSVIACLVVAGVLAPVLAAWQWYLGDAAMLAPALFKRFNFVLLGLASMASRWCMLVVVYYLPIQFQAALGHSATKSGLDLLPFMLSMVLTLIISGIIVKKTGKYKIFLCVGPILAIAGMGAMVSFRADTPFSRIIGFQILLGVGIGMFFQLSLLAAQAEFADARHLQGKVSGGMAFFQMLGGVIGLAIGGAIFEDKLNANLARYAPGVSVAAARAPTSIRELLSGQDVQDVVTAYMQSLKWVYVVGPPVAAVAFILLIFTKERPLGPPGGAPKPKDAEKGESVDEKVKEDVEEGAVVASGVPPAVMDRADSGLSLEKQSSSKDAMQTVKV